MGFVGLFALFSSTVWAATACRINITYQLVGGEKRESYFYAAAKDKKECQKESEKYRQNVMPDTVTDKVVKAEWTGP